MGEINKEGKNDGERKQKNFIVKTISTHYIESVKY